MKEKKKIWRGQRNKNSMQKFVVMLNNVRGVKTKQAAINRIIQEHSPAIIALGRVARNLLILKNYMFLIILGDCMGVKFPNIIHQLAFYKF